MMAKNHSRTTNTIYNFTSSIGGQVITIIMQFVVRTVFINTLGKSYLGINGLFSNILSMLSLAELGVGSAILFKLYEPISKEDHNRLAILMKFYKKVYMVIGICVAIVGLCLIPFLRLIISDYDKLQMLGINAVFIYILYLLQSVSSYLFFAYKSSIIKANQKEYLLNFISYVFTFVSSVVQIILLVAFHSFELYVIVLVISVIFQNCVGAVLANRMYPYINNSTEDKISKYEIKEIFKDCSAIFLYRLNGVVLKATDNIVISAFIGLEMVGIYSNYYILYSTINTIFVKIFESVVHSLGNLHAINNREHEYKVFKTSNFIAVILGATAGVGIFCVANEFIQSWIGHNWIIAQPFALLMGLEVYTLSTRIFLSKYRNAMGLFQQAKYRPLAGMLINIVVSILLVNKLGVVGVLIGTIVADWLTLMWFDPFIIYKHGFEDRYSVKRYYFKNLKYLGITIAMAVIDYIICTNFLTGYGWLSVLVHSIICGLTVPVVFFLTNIKNDECVYIVELTKKILKKLTKK